MPPTVKENAISTARTETASRTASTGSLPGETSAKQQPVALEVPVSVNGARAMEGSEKREPFSETTKTVLVFGNGAVIRLSSSVAPGQLLFLTNERSKKEVVCQVVKSKNYRNVSGYVELEFTEPAVGFWGLRFPGDRISSASQPAASAPATNVTPSAVVAKPAAPAGIAKESAPTLSDAKFSAPTAPVTPSLASPSVEKPGAQKPVAPVAPLSVPLSTSLDLEASLHLRSTTPHGPVVPTLPVAPVSAAPEFTVNSEPAKPVLPESVLFDAPRQSEVQASILEPASAQAVPVTSTAPNLLALFEAKPTTPEIAPPPLVQVFADPETETLNSQTLKQHTARLQEQLSNMTFSGEPATVSAQIPLEAPVAAEKEPAENTAKILDRSQPRTPEPAPTAPVQAVKLEPLPAKSLLRDEELQVPAWLEPLARNSDAPSSTQELVEREKSKRLAEQPKVEKIAPETVTAVEEHSIPELQLPTFGNALPFDEEKNNGPRSSNNGILIGAIAAGVLLLTGGGWWYVQQQSGGVHAGPASASNVQASVAALSVASSPSPPQGNRLPETNTAAPSNLAGRTNISAPSNSGPNTLSVMTAGSSAATARNLQPTSNPANASAAATTLASAQPAAEPPKKPILGEVHLAKPKVTPSRHAQNGVEPDAGIAFDSEEQPGAEALNAGFVGGSNQPSAPTASLPVGGDVKQARLISSVPPVYPTLAKNQHVSGNVLLDALIDASGHVTSMKVVSGPTLLHQAAMDALKQWKYHPASLDGKPVPMHLTVTIQFRLQ